MLQFLTESSRDFTETQTVGGFRNNSASSFDTIFEEAYENMMASGVNVLVDINSLFKNKAQLKAYKDALLTNLAQECAAMEENPDNYGTHVHL